MSLPKHRYIRQFDTASADSLAQLSEWVPVGATVLELGPAEGYFTRHLQETRQCVIDAVEIDHAMAEKARPWCRLLVEGDLDSMELGDTFPAGSYDVIVLADVLEHLRFPDRLLRQLSGLLKTDGACLISVPNIAYGGLIAELLEGHFDYRSEGLLDRTHLRFFTQHSLATLLSETGWHPWEWQSVVLPFFESEFRTRVETLPSALAGLLDSQPELHCYQWLARIKRLAPESPPPLPDKPFSQRFPVRLFWAAAAEAFVYSQSRIAWATVGSERQAVSFALPKTGQVPQLRLRLADRPAFLRLYSIQVLDDEGRVLWRWASEFGALALGNAMADMTCAEGGAYTLANLHSTESWLDLPCSNNAKGVAGSVVVELGWPMSADFGIAQQAWERALIPLQMEMNSVKALVGTRDFELATRDAAIAERERLIVSRDATLLVRDAAIAEREGLIAVRDAALVERDRIITARDAMIAERDDALQCLSADLAAQRAIAAEQSAQITTLYSEIARMRSFSWWLRRTLHWPVRAVQRLRKS